MIAPMLTQFVPAFIAHQVAQNPAPLLAPRAEAWPAAVLFADIVGFTALTERLAEQGPAGAETLTHILNDYFGQLINLITWHGGDVVKFAGDALLAVWPAAAEAAESNDLLFNAALAAAHCAQTLQSALRGYRTADGQLLALHIGIGVGEVVVAQLGGVNGRWELLVTGTAVAQVSLAEAKAGPGAVVLSPEAWALLREIGTGWALANGYVELQTLSPQHTPPVKAPPLIDLSSESERALRAYIPGAILARLAAGQRDWLAELRRVTILFVTLPGYGQTVLQTEGLIHAQTVMQSLQIALYRFEGSLNKLNVDDKGGRLWQRWGCRLLPMRMMRLAGCWRRWPCKRPCARKGCNRPLG